MEEILVSEMENNTLQLIDEEGKVVDFPIIGMFSVEGKYYVVVYVEPDDKFSQGEMLVLRVEKDGDHEFIQMITDRDEWELVTATWQKIASKVDKEGVTPVVK